MKVRHWDKLNCFLQVRHWDKLNSLSFLHNDVHIEPSLALSARNICNIFMIVSDNKMILYIIPCSWSGNTFIWTNPNCCENLSWIYTGNLNKFWSTVCIKIKNTCFHTGAKLVLMNWKSYIKKKINTENLNSVYWVHIIIDMK